MANSTEGMSLSQKDLRAIDLYLVSEGKFLVPYNEASDSAEPTERGKQLALSLAFNLAGLGYKIDSDSMDKLARLEENELAMIWDGIKKSVVSYIGKDAFDRAPLFYPNFPEQVLEMDEYDLHLNALIYYAGYFYFGTDLHDDLVPEKAKERLPLVEKFPTAPKVLKGISLEDLHKEMSSVMHSMAIRDDQADFLRNVYAEVFPKEFERIATDPGQSYASKEVMAAVGGILCEKKNVSAVRQMFHDAPDVIRFAAYLSNQSLGAPVNRLDLSGKLHFHLNNQQKKLVRELLANCPHLYEDIWMRPSEETWKHFARHIDSRNEYPERTYNAMQKLYRRDKTDEFGKPVQSIERQFELAWANDITRLMQLAENFPGLYLRHVLSYVESDVAMDPSDLMMHARLAREAASKIDPVTALELVNVIRERYSQEARVFTKPNGDTQIRMNDRKDMLTKDQQDRLVSYIYQGVITGLRDTKELGNVYIDPALTGIMAPKRDVRNASGDVVLTKYSRIPGKEGKNLIAIGANWKGDGVDVDVSVAAFNKDYEQVGNLYYGNLKTSWGCHSGDYVTAPDGASEICIVDKDILKKEGIRYVALEVHGFSCPFDKAEEGVKVILMEKEGSLQTAKERDCHKDPRGNGLHGEVTFLGEVVEPTQVEYPIRLNSNSTQEIAYIYDVEQDLFVWVDKAGGHGLGRNIVLEGENEFRCCKEIYAIEHCTIPTMETVIQAYLDAGNGRRVSDIRDADTIFVLKPIDGKEMEIREGAVTYSASEINRFSADFCKKQPKTEERETPVREKNLNPEKEQETKKLSPLEAAIERAKEHRNPARNQRNGRSGDDPR